MGQSSLLDKNRFWYNFCAVPCVAMHDCKGICYSVDCLCIGKHVCIFLLRSRNAMYFYTIGNKVFRYEKKTNHRFKESQNSWTWKDTLSNPQLLKADSRLPRNMSICILNISKDGDFTASVGKLFQLLTILKGEKKKRLNSMHFSLCPLPLLLQLEGSVCLLHSLRQLLEYTDQILLRVLPVPSF